MASPLFRNSTTTTDTPFFKSGPYIFLRKRLASSQVLPHSKRKGARNSADAATNANDDDAKCND